MATLIPGDLIGIDLIERLETSLRHAIRLVEERDAESAHVGITFTVKQVDGEPLIDFTHKSTTTTKGSWRPGAEGQMRLIGGEADS